MRVFISADMEGVAGVANFNQLVGKDGYKEACRLMTGEVNAVVAGAFDAGAERVVVCDAHWRGDNILLEELDERAEIVRGDFRRYGMMEGVERGMDAAIFIGYHAHAGTTPAVFPHSFSGRIVYEVRVNERHFGETALNAALAGSFGVPVVLVSGDDAVCSEAASTIHGVTVLTTKHALNNGAAVLIHPKKAKELLRIKAKEALTTRAARPLRLPEPLTIQVRFTRPVFADAASLIPHIQRTSELTVQTEVKTFKEAYTLIQAMILLASSVPRG